MHKKVLAAAAACSLLSLAGCSSGDHAAEKGSGDFHQYSQYGSGKADNQHDAGSQDGPGAKGEKQTDSRDASNESTASETVTVAEGDSLWSISEGQLGEGTTPAEVLSYVEELYWTNLDVVGDDPNLIFPGQTLTLP